MIIVALFIILFIVLILPFAIKKVEENLELFLFSMGVLAVSVTSQWSFHIIEEALVEPIKITAAVLIAGLLFRELKGFIEDNVNRMVNLMGLRLFSFLLVFSLGLASSMITAIIAALVLVEVISHLKLDKKHETKLVILSCFSIGLGAALTPIGEPLSTIATAKLKGAPYFAGFWFLATHLWLYIISSLFIFGAIAAYFSGKHLSKGAGLKEKSKEHFKNIVMRTGKIYLFVMALIFLGTGFKPLIDNYIAAISPEILYWINIFSAVLDNATLTAAEIAPSMSLYQIKSALVALLISGGMLIPGNIPNIIAANKLGIKSKDWAKFGIPVGLAVLGFYFIIILLVH
ncbi:MAG: cation transporter [Candidatus Firestonebacteria bacterium RIFOXYD2_FULL_39_29]|nr:MAG: cation transporter [Candidatus Firestonebacteria bacterium RIFOXYD2_FULL_39_29]